MRIETDRKTLRDALTGLRKTMPRVRGMPRCVNFEVREGQALAAAGGISECAARKLGPGKGSGSAAVCLDDLSPLSKGAGSERIEIDFDGSNAVLRAFVGGQAIEQSAACPSTGENALVGPAIETAPAPGLLSKIRRAAPSADREAVRDYLRGICLDSRENRVVASDGRRLTAIEGIGMDVSGRPIVPATDFVRWKRLGDEARIGFGEEESRAWVRIETDDWIWQARCLAGEFPNWRQVVPDSAECEIELGRTDAALLERVLPSLPGGRSANRPVALRGLEDGVYLLSPAGDGEWSELRLESSVRIGSGTIVFDRALLLDALAAGFRSLRFADKHSPALFDDGAGAMHVLMPLRIEVPEAERAAKAA